MRGSFLCLFAGILAVLVTDVLAPPAGSGLAVVAWPVADGHAMPQVVNRAQKSDRLQIPFGNSRRTPPPATPTMPVGCEPVFSALSSAARANYPGRCIA
jgi:hypothetical protein